MEASSPRIRGDERKKRSQTKLLGSHCISKEATLVDKITETNPAAMMTTFTNQSSVESAVTVATNFIGTTIHFSCSGESQNNLSPEKDDLVTMTTDSKTSDCVTSDSIAITGFTINVCEPLLLSVVDMEKVLDINDDSGAAVVAKRRYPRRSVEKKKYSHYVEEELLDEDEYLCCEKCKLIHYRDCCNPLDPLYRLTLTPYNSQHEEATVQYTAMPLPRGLTLKPSSHGANGVGIFAIEDIPKGVRFGPYKGRRLYQKDLKEGMETSYMWEVKQGTMSYFIDGEVESESNWMRYINPARNEEEHNLVVFQYKGNVYYRSFKHINAGNELFVWCGDQYARELGISSAFNEQGNDELNQKFVCKNCGNLFKVWSSFELHLRCNKLCFEANPGACTNQMLSQKTSDIVEDQTDAEAIAVDDNKLNNEKTTCSYCGKEFKTKKLLWKHARIHTSTRPHICEYCGKRFIDKGVLTTHIRCHTGDKPFVCESCGKSFISNSHLTKHKRVHTGDKPYSCHYCKRQFADGSNLKKHIHCTHTGDKPYQCQYCKTGFTREDNLRRHIFHTHNSPHVEPHATV